MNDIRAGYLVAVVVTDEVGTVLVGDAPVLLGVD